MDKAELERKVLAFVQDQPGFSKGKLKIDCENAETWYILYGEDPQIGIAGFGKTAEDALTNFKENWAEYGGESWISANSK